MKDSTRWRPWYDPGKESIPPEETWWTQEWFAGQWRAFWKLPSGSLFVLLISLPVVMVIGAGRIASATLRKLGGGL